MIYYFLSDSWSILLYSHCNLRTCIKMSKHVDTRDCFAHSVLYWLKVRFSPLVVYELTHCKVILFNNLKHKNNTGWMNIHQYYSNLPLPLQVGELYVCFIVIKTFLNIWKIKLLWIWIPMSMATLRVSYPCWESCMFWMTPSLLPSSSPFSTSSFFLLVPSG